jgi:hypothetical protein
MNKKRAFLTCTWIILIFLLLLPYNTFIIIIKMLSQVITQERISEIDAKIAEMKEMIEKLENEKNGLLRIVSEEKPVRLLQNKTPKIVAKWLLTLEKEFNYRQVSKFLSEHGLTSVEVFNHLMFDQDKCGDYYISVSQACKIITIIHDGISGWDERKVLLNAFTYNYLNTFICPDQHVNRVRVVFRKITLKGRSPRACVSN